MTLGKVWIRRHGGTVQVGRFLREGEEFLVSWDGLDELLLSRQPPGVITVEEGSLRFQALTGTLGDRFAAAPADVVRELLREQDAPLDAEAIQQHLRKLLELDPESVRAGWPVASSVLRNDPHVSYDPSLEEPSFRWSSAELTPDPDADLRRRPWQFLVGDLVGAPASPPHLEILQQRLLTEPPGSITTLLILAALGLVPWPAAEAVAAAVAELKSGAELGEFPDPALALLRGAAVRQGRRDVCWLLASVPRLSEPLADLETDLAPVDADDPLPVAVLTTLAQLQKRSNVGRTDKIVIIVLGRLPACPGRAFAAARARVVGGIRDATIRGQLAQRPESVTTPELETTPDPGTAPPAQPSLVSAQPDSTVRPRAVEPLHRPAEARATAAPVPRGVPDPAKDPAALRRAAQPDAPIAAAELRQTQVIAALEARTDDLAARLERLTVEVEELRRRLSAAEAVNRR